MNSSFHTVARLRSIVSGSTCLALVISWQTAAMAGLFTLSQVTFEDGGVASGYFNFDPMTRVLGAYEITTTDGTSGSLKGHTYASGGTWSDQYFYYYDSGVYQYEVYAFSNNVIGGLPTDYSGLNLSLHTHITRSGIYPLEPGTSKAETSGSGSCEFTQRPVLGSGILPRLITSGSLVVTGVPDSGSSGLLLVCAVGALAGLARITSPRLQLSA